MKNILTLCALTALTLSATSHLTLAHSSLVQDEAQAGSSYKAIIRIPHGCDGKATTAVKLDLPEGFIGAQPQMKPGWTIETVKGDYEKAYPLHGKDVKSGVKQVSWSGGNIPDEFYDEFVVAGRLAQFDKDSALSFPVTQYCGSDASVAWTEIAKDGEDPHSLKHPAPQLRVLAAAGSDMHGSHGMGSHGTGGHDMHGSMQAPADDIKLGELTLSAPSIRAMVPGAKVAGGYITITNAGKDADRLIKVTSATAQKVEIHEMKMDGQVMKMRELSDGLALPAGETVELKPGGFHLMFMQPSRIYAEGETIAARFEFEKAGAIDVNFTVTAKSKSGAAHSSH